MPSWFNGKLVSLCLRPMTISIARGGPEGRRSCNIASYSSYCFSGLVTTWRRPPPLQVCWSAREKAFKIPRHSWGLSPGHGEDREWDSFILSLSYHDPGHREDRQGDSFILPLGYYDPGHREDRQWDSFILPLGYHDSGHREDRQWDSFILPPGYHDWPANSRKVNGSEN